jgi:F0F1-type ATP synthase delta subunit
MDKQTLELAILGLEEQSRKINEALRDLKTQLSNGSNSRRATVAAVVTTSRTFSPAQRRAISARMKRAWARRKAQAAGHGSAAVSKKRRLTAEQKRAISERMKATWAARRRSR